MHKCEQCGKLFNNGYQLGGHRTAAHSGTFKRKILERIIVKKTCPKCGNDFRVERTVNKDGTQNINKKEKKFCSRSCANGHIHSEETKKKMSESSSRELSSNWKGGISSKMKSCTECGKKIRFKNKTGLCRECWNIKRKTPYDKRSFKYQCKFNFNVENYSDKFNLDLINKHGWYKPTNYHTPNLNGVSLDHMYSVTEAYQNKVSSDIVSHPANCIIMLHKENNSKNDSSSITLEELKERIRNW